MHESNKPTASPPLGAIAEAGGQDSKAPLVLVCGPWGSGTSAVAGMLANAGLWAPGPHIQLKDPRTTQTYEMRAFRDLLMRFVSELTFEQMMNSHDIVQELTHFRDTVLAEARARDGISANQLLLLKHALPAFLLPEMDQVFDLKVVCVVRPLGAIEKTRLRRNWHVNSGEFGARKIYEKLFDYMTNSETPFHFVRYADVLNRPEAVLAQFGSFLGFSLDDSAIERAKAFVEKPVLNKQNNNR